MTDLLFTLSLAGPISPNFIPPYPTQQCQATDQGVQIVILVQDGAGNPVNLRNASSIKVLLVRPSGVGVETTATFFTNGIDGQMAFETGVSTPLGTGLDEVGSWLLQGKMTIAGKTQFTAVGAFQVNANLGA